MSVVVGCSAHGSPGVSTVLQVLASLWNTDALPVVVEADASGGVLAARYELSLTPGFVTLAESLRKFETPALIDHAQRLPSGAACVPLSPSATAASAQLRSAGPSLGPYLAQSGHPVLVDAGTLLPDGKGVAAVTAADLLLWFVRPTREELLVLRHRLAECPQPETSRSCWSATPPTTLTRSAKPSRPKCSTPCPSIVVAPRQSTSAATTASYAGANSRVPAPISSRSCSNASGQRLHLLPSKYRGPLPAGFSIAGRSLQRWGR